MSRFIVRAALAAILALGCSDSTSPRVPLAMAFHRWSERGPASYSVRMLLHLNCECNQAVQGWVVTTVTNGVVESRRIEATGVAVPDDLAHFYPSIEGLFEVIAESLNDGMETVTVSFDPRLGYPTRIHADDEVRVIDDWNFTYHVRDLVIR